MFSVRKRSANVAAANVLSVRKQSDSNNKSGSSDAPQEALLCAKAKRQRQMFYLCESEASATKRPVGTEINHMSWLLSIF
ncbi:hypothetical protein [Lysinibacillus xylanilyticus]|nr:hypothetical protein [Lysinibacillus xylanilyticus]